MNLIYSLFFYVGLVYFVYWFFVTGNYKHLDKYIKNFKNLFAIHPKGPKPVPKHIKPTPFHLNRFKEIEAKKHLTYFKTCGFILDRVATNSLSIVFKTPCEVKFIIQNVTNYNRSPLIGYDGTVFIVKDKNESVLGTFNNREEAMTCYYNYEDTNAKLREITHDLVQISGISKKLKNKKDILSKMKTDLEKDFE